MAISKKRINAVRTAGWLLLCLLAWQCPSGIALSENMAPEQWGVAMGLRSATIAFDAEQDRVNDVVPLFFYEGERLFLHGLTAGYRLVDRARWELSALARYRFFDIPKEYQNQVREDGLDFGGQFKYRISTHFETDFELLTEEHGRTHANIVANFPFETVKWEFTPFLQLRWKSADFNNAYYGLDIEKPGSAVDYTAGAQARLHVISNLYLLGRAEVTFLDQRTRDLEFVDKSVLSSIFVGFGFFNDKKKPRIAHLQSKPYLRLAHGWATPSNLGEILSFGTRSDPYNNQLTSIFYGHPLSDELFTLPISVYLTPGLVIHHHSEVQDTFAEYVLAVKFYYTVKWPTPWRLGFAEGLSYATEIPYVERTELEAKGYRPSELLNYLDFSLDVSLGHLFRRPAIENLWLGYSIHHRSGIFSTSSAFGRVSGGSNYNTIYLQYHW